MAVFRELAAVASVRMAACLEEIAMTGIVPLYADGAVVVFFEILFVSSSRGNWFGEFEKALQP